MNNYTKIWEIILNELSKIYSDEVFRETFSNIKKINQIEEKIIISVETEFIKNKIYKMYFEKIQKITKLKFEEKIIIEFVSEKNKKNYNFDAEKNHLENIKEEFKNETENDFCKIENNNKFKNNKHFEKNEEKQIENKTNNETNVEIENRKISFNKYNYGNTNTKYSFDNFVVGKSNNFAFKIAKKIAEEKKVTTNPLYIFGKAGIGKTHLIQAIGNHILKKTHSAKKILYVKADGFIEEFTNQLRKAKMEDFNEKYRDIDLLLVDDIQIMAGATRTQMEFFKLFDYLYLNQKQIVITSDKQASELKNIMSRLTSRFEAGLMVDIQSPDFNHRLNILKKKILEFEPQNPLKIKKDVLELIASSFVNNVREMEGALLRLLNYAQIFGYDIDINIANEALELLIKSKKSVSYDEDVLEKIKLVVSNFFNISVRDLMSKKKQQKYTFPRHIAMYLIKELKDIPYNIVGSFFKRNHSAVFKAYQKIKKNSQSDYELKKSLELILKKINS
ncbi:chromosomal replication initiator protein DnaA [Candidatus Phytoplasma tritici]|nr:chromosomal replication initiator protein DnaA [Candidatus Phytoplasma tritici]